jgi:hypothetical protein
MLPALAVGAVALVAAGCGGSSSSSSSTSSSSDANSLLASAKLPDKGPSKIALSLKITLAGSPKGQYAVFAGKPITLDVTGTTDSQDKKQDLKFDAAAGPLAVTGAYMQDGDKAWLQFQGKWYELPKNALSSVTGQATGATTTTTTPSSSSSATSTLTKAFSNPRALITQVKVVGDESVGSVTTTHVSGIVDMAALVRAMASASKAAGSSTPVSPASVADAVSQVRKYVKTTSVGVWVGKDDQVIHKASVVIDGKVPASSAASSGVSGFTFSADVVSTPTSAPTITPPTGAAPFSQLQQDLGSMFGGLGSSVGGGSSG